MQVHKSGISWFMCGIPFLIFCRSLCLLSASMFRRLPVHTTRLVAPVLRGSSTRAQSTSQIVATQQTAQARQSLPRSSAANSPDLPLSVSTKRYIHLPALDFVSSAPFAAHQHVPWRSQDSVFELKAGRARFVPSSPQMTQLSCCKLANRRRWARVKSPSTMIPRGNRLKFLELM